MTMRVVVFGAGGLAGGELIRLLMLHPEGFDITAHSRSKAGSLASDIHRCLTHLPMITFVDTPIDEAAAKADVVFFALPHGESQSMMKQILAADPKCVVDLAADFRIKDPDLFAKYFGEHKCPELIEGSVYGLPEAFAEKIKESKLIANPGCFATAAELLLLPLADASLLPKRNAVFAVTGSTGSGIKPKPTTHHPFRDGNLFAYKMLNHQHEAEINQTLTGMRGIDANCRLLAHSGPFVRGIHATTYMHRHYYATDDIETLYQDYYATMPFVTVLDRPPHLAEINGTNYVHLFVHQQGSEVEISLVLDNLVKGAAGQAIQNMNLSLGLDETAGLTFPGIFPC